MARGTDKSRARSDAIPSSPAALRRRTGKRECTAANSRVHALGTGVVCDTDRRGFATPHGAPPDRIVLNASEGFIPLWAPNSTLRWRFRASSFEYFEDPQAAMDATRQLVADALKAWGDAAPVTFANNEDVWDFEIVMRGSDDCDGGGCVLASAFFPDAGRHKLEIYPKMFSQSRKEQVDTLIHEIGHVFGLRHFFAQVSESAWPSEIFGTHSKFSIMNYGELSELTTADRDDLRRLYQLAWSGALKDVNGTPIRFVEPYHTLSLVSSRTQGCCAAAMDVPALDSPLRPRSAGVRAAQAFAR